MKKIIYDQDGLGRRDHNLYGLLVLLQAPDVELVGLTTVSGREWSPRQFPRAKQVLESLERPEVPVVGGAVFPLLNSPARSALWESVHGALFDRLCHELDELDEPTDIDPFFIPGPPGRVPTLERPSSGAGCRADFGADRAKEYTESISSRGPQRKVPADRRDTTRARDGARPTEEPAAAWMVRMARQMPSELSIVATGPLTNLALACRLDPAFPQLVRELIFVGGRFRPFSQTGLFTRTPSRREANFRHDPEAAHIVLQAEWNRLLCLPRDLTDTVRISREMHESIAKTRTPVGRFLRELPHELYTKGDALAAAVCAEPGLVKATDKVCMDVDLGPGANYGCTLNWREVDFAPATNQRPVEVVTAVDEKAFDRAFVKWCGARMSKPRKVLTQRRQDRTQGRKVQAR